MRRTSPSMCSWSVHSPPGAVKMGMASCGSLSSCASSDSEASATATRPGTPTHARQLQVQASSPLSTTAIAPRCMRVGYGSRLVLRALRSLARSVSRCTALWINPSPMRSARTQACISHVSSPTAHGRRRRSCGPPARALNAARRTPERGTTRTATSQVVKPPRVTSRPRPAQSNGAGRKLGTMPTCMAECGGWPTSSRRRPPKRPGRSIPMCVVSTGRAGVHIVWTGPRQQEWIHDGWAARWATDRAAAPCARARHR